MLSLTGEYALRAVVFLAQRADEWPVPGREIAAETGIPGKYLLSILSTLARAEILDSSPGQGGGFSLARSAREIMLFEVLAPLEQPVGAGPSCPFGNGPCDEEDPCPAHDRWERMRDEYSRFLEETSVDTVAFKARDRRGGSETRRKRR